MRAVAFTRYLPIDHPESFLDVEVPTPTPKGHDLLVSVHAVAVNPVDTKVRAPKDKVEASPRIIGWDASGVVQAVGQEVSPLKSVTLFTTQATSHALAAMRSFNWWMNALLGTNPPDSLTLKQRPYL